jgi:hypothetical protein
LILALLLVYVSGPHSLISFQKTRDWRDFDLDQLTRRDHKWQIDRKVGISWCTLMNWYAWMHGAWVKHVSVTYFKFAKMKNERFNITTCTFSTTSGVEVRAIWHDRSYAFLKNFWIPEYKFLFKKCRESIIESAQRYEYGRPVNALRTKYWSFAWIMHSI